MLTVVLAKLSNILVLPMPGKIQYVAKNILHKNSLVEPETQSFQYCRKITLIRAKVYTFSFHNLLIIFLGKICVL